MKTSLSAFAATAAFALLSPSLLTVACLLVVGTVCGVRMVLSIDEEDDADGDAEAV